MKLSQTELSLAGNVAKRQKQNGKFPGNGRKKRQKKGRKKAEKKSG
jgi:hypothetical protein